MQREKTAYERMIERIEKKKQKKNRWIDKRETKKRENERNREKSVHNFTQRARILWPSNCHLSHI